MIKKIVRWVTIRYVLSGLFIFLGFVKIFLNNNLLDGRIFLIIGFIGAISTFIISTLNKGDSGN
jgi:hypothetical protein